MSTKNTSRYTQYYFGIQSTADAQGVAQQEHLFLLIDQLKSDSGLSRQDMILTDGNAQ